MLRCSLLTLAGAMLALCLLISPAYAQAPRTWVSGVGDDANPCSRTAPCKTFAGAISKTAAGGEINCIDPGGYGAVTITKSLIISCEAGTAGVLVSGTNGIVVYTAATDTVYLRGLDIEGLTIGLSGIYFNNLGTLHVEHCLIRGFNAGAAAGINFAPAGAAALFVSESYLSENGSGFAGGGVLVQPHAAGNVRVMLSDIHADNNSSGFRIDNTSAAATVTASIVDSDTSGNTQNSGVVAYTSAASGPTTVMIDRLTSSNNSTGVWANGPKSNVLIGSSVVTGNSHGAYSTGGGTIQSYKDNQINGNSTDGTPITAVGLN
jgi:hypothetical protein